MSTEEIKNLVKEELKKIGFCSFRYKDEWDEDHWVERGLVIHSRGVFDKNIYELYDVELDRGKLIGYTCYEYMVNLEEFIDNNKDWELILKNVIRISKQLRGV